MCSRDLKTTLRDISPNEYQTETNRHELVQRHFEQLSDFFFESVPAAAFCTRDFEVRTIRITHPADEKTEGIAEDVVVPAEIPPEVAEVPPEVPSEVTEVPTTVPTEVTKVTAEDPKKPDVVTEVPAECRRPFPMDVAVDRRCVDLRGMDRLAKLCSFLETNVRELKMVYHKRRQLCDEYYTDADLDSGLLCLVEDVNHLLDTLNAASGYRNEVKKVVDMYTELETRYRTLRSLNKSAKLRHKKCQKCAGENGTGCKDHDEPGRFDICNRMYKWLRSAFAFICRDKNSKS